MSQERWWDRALDRWLEDWKRSRYRQGLPRAATAMSRAGTAGRQLSTHRGELFRGSRNSGAFSQRNPIDTDEHAPTILQAEAALRDRVSFKIAQLCTGLPV